MRLTYRAMQPGPSLLKGPPPQKKGLLLLRSPFKEPPKKTRGLTEPPPPFSLPSRASPSRRAELRAAGAVGGRHQGVLRAADAQAPEHHQAIPEIGPIGAGLSGLLYCS